MRVEFLPSAARDYRGLDRSIAPRIRRAFDVIAHDPDSGKPLQGPFRGLRSYRVGDYRIVYKLELQPPCVLICRIGHRRDIYR